MQANTNYEAYQTRGVDKRGRKFGRPPNPYTPPPARARKINTTDLDSRNVKTPRGWVQGYNAQGPRAHRNAPAGKPYSPPRTRRARSRCPPASDSPVVGRG